MKRGAFQGAVYLYDQGKRLPATFTHWPRRCYGGQGVLRTGKALRPGLCPGTSPAPADPSSGAPPHRKAAQLASGPGARPRGAATHCSVSKPEQHWLPDGRHDDEAPTWKGELRQPSRCSSPRMRLATTARRPRPLEILQWMTGDCCCCGLRIQEPQIFCASECTEVGSTHDLL